MKSPTIQFVWEFDLSVWMFGIGLDFYAGLQLALFLGPVIVGVNLERE